MKAKLVNVYGDQDLYVLNDEYFDIKYTNSKFNVPIFILCSDAQATSYDVAARIKTIDNLDMRSFQLIILATPSTIGSSESTHQAKANIIKYAKKHNINRFIMLDDDVSFNFYNKNKRMYTSRKGKNKSKRLSSTDLYFSDDCALGSVSSVRPDYDYSEFRDDVAVCALWYFNLELLEKDGWKWWWEQFDNYGKHTNLTCDYWTTAQALSEGKKVEILGKIQRVHDFAIHDYKIDIYRKYTRATLARWPQYFENRVAYTKGKPWANIRFTGFKPLGKWKVIRNKILATKLGNTWMNFKYKFAKA